MEKKRNTDISDRIRSLLPIVMVVATVFGCRKGEVGLAKASPSPDTAKASPQTQVRTPSQDTHIPESNLTTYFDSIGPALSGDFNGDGMGDTARGVHVRSSGSIHPAPFRKVTLDTTSPYEDLCGGWGVFLVFGGGASTDRMYFCGQQARIQEFSWVGTAGLDTLSFPELKAKAGKGVSEVLTLFSQAGITVYLYFDGADFKIYEPDEEP